MAIWHTSHEPIFLINKYIFIRYFIVTFGAEVACKWRDPAMLRCPYFSDENLPSREFGSSSRCVATRKIMAGPPYSWWSTFWMTNLWDIHLQESWGSLIFGWKPREIQLTNRKDIGEIPVFDSTIMGNPWKSQFSWDNQGTFQFLMAKIMGNGLNSLRVRSTTYHFRGIPLWPGPRFQ